MTPQPLQPFLHDLVTVLAAPTQVLSARDGSLDGVADASAPLILLNPPFHIGAAVHTGIAERLIADAGRALAPGGELWCVWNGHLGYRPLLDRIGETRQVSRNAKFVVTATRRR